MKLIIEGKNFPIKVCNSFKSRLIGFMFYNKEIKEGLVFPKCNSIHTFFMCQKIDVIMADKNNKILYLYPNLKSFRIIFPKKNVYYVYELKKGSTNSLKINDILITKERD